ncbi:hypothetical protein Hanom_Chr06g00574411 [Helianthus anomalus]
MLKCDACRKEHKGSFYQCTKCSGPFIYSHCASLPKKLQIQHTTNNLFLSMYQVCFGLFSCSMCFGLFICDMCSLLCNRFSYGCETCNYYIGCSKYS